MDAKAHKKTRRLNTSGLFFWESLSQAQKVTVILEMTVTWQAGKTFRSVSKRVREGFERTLDSFGIESRVLSRPVQFSVEEITGSSVF